MTTLSDKTRIIRGYAARIVDLASELERQPGTSVVPSRILLFPDYVTSRNDGDLHYISAGRLEELYRLSPAEKKRVRTVPPKVRFSEQPGDIKLRPRHDGHYDRVAIGLDPLPQKIDGYFMGVDLAVGADKTVLGRLRGTFYSDGMRLGRESRQWEIDALTRQIERLKRENVGLTGDLNQAVDRIDKMKREAELMPTSCLCGLVVGSWVHSREDHVQCAGEIRCHGHVFGTATTSVAPYGGKPL